MEDQEFEGKTAEEAIQKASRELNVPEEDLEIDILETGSSGIFGMGGRKAKIRVHLKHGEPEAEIDEEEELIPEVLSHEHHEHHEHLERDEYDLDDYGPEKASEAAPLSPEDVSVAEGTLRKILGLIPLEATVRGENNNGKINLLIEGDRSGLLIGRKGKTLDALQFIVNKIVNKALDKKISIVVDSENYRKRREEILTEMALRMGDKAKRIKKPVTTSPLNPHERRIIHLALKGNDHLDTKSRGEGLLKRVIIIPKR
jgi:spoIIIJ-associated protein